MIDRQLIRENPDIIKDAVENRGYEFDVDELVGIEAKRRELLSVEKLRARQNELADKIGEAVRAGDEAEELKAEASKLSEEIDEMEQELNEVEDQFGRMMLEVPNVPHPDVPVGADEEDNEVIKTWGERKNFSYEPLGHWELGEQLGILNFEQARRIAGARFVCNNGAGATLERALINFFVNLHIREHNYTEVFPPILANEDSLIGTGSLPKFEQDLFKTTAGYYLIPTAEVPLTNMHQGQILGPDALPKYYTAYTPCFRSEAGAAGRESRGIIRQHQFHKVELMKFIEPGNGDEELENLTRDAEKTLELLELPYRRVALCTGDLTFSAAQTFDLEVWMPGMNSWVEISSCSQYGAFQARRCNTRYRPEKQAKPEFVHTMNGSGLATGRTVAAIVENYQTEQGTVIVPEPLRPYMGGMAEILPEQ